MAHSASGSAILDVVYAFDARPGDERIAQVERAVATFSNLLVAGIYLGLSRPSPLSAR